MFPEIPSELSAVEDEQLATLRDELFAQIKHVATNRRDPNVVGDLSQSQVTDELEKAVTTLEQIKDEIQARADEAAAYDTEIERLAAKAGVDATDEKTDADDEDGAADDAKTDDEAETAEPETEAEKPEPIAASASNRRKPLPAARRHKPQPTEFDNKGLRITTHAAGLGVGLEVGTLLDRRLVGETLTEMVKKRIKPGERAVVAAAAYDYPPERILDQRAGDLNAEKIQKVVGPAALVASGALCAPLTPIYDLPGVETADRPVRDALPSFQAARGGVTVGATPRLGDYDAAVDTVTAADNAAGGTFATKTCMRIDCPDFASVQVDAIYACIEADNLAARAYPELMARIDELVRATQARMADSRLLTEMRAGSTRKTGGTLAAGAVYSLLGDVYKAAAQLRSANRMPEGARLRALFPAWIIDLLSLDVARGVSDRFQTRQQIVAILEGAGINAAFYLDGSSTATHGQVFAHATNGTPLAEFPTTAEWFIYPEGSWLHLDSGVLELGVVRDSALNATNDFQIFSETWEQIVFVGVESLAVTSSVCPSGEVAAAADVSGICGT